MKIILLGSSSTHKIQAVEDVFRDVLKEEAVSVMGVKVPSSANEQPVGHEETILGALSRIRNAKEMTLGSYDYIVGIENGVIEINISGTKHWFDIAWIAVQDKGGNVSLAPSAGVEFDPEYIEEAKKRGYQTTTAGMILAERNKTDKDNPHIFLTNNLVDRLDIMKQAIRIALGQLHKKTT